MGLVRNYYRREYRNEILIVPMLNEMFSPYYWQFWLILALVLMFLIWLGRDYLSQLLPADKREISNPSVMRPIPGLKEDQEPDILPKFHSYKFCPHCGINLQTLLEKKGVKFNVPDSRPSSPGIDRQAPSNVKSPPSPKLQILEKQEVQNSHRPNSSRYQDQDEEVLEVIPKRRQKLDLTPKLPAFLEPYDRRLQKPSSRRSQSPRRSTSSPSTLGVIVGSGSESVPTTSPRNISRPPTSDTVSGLGSAPEEECRRILESIYGAPFPRRRPSWLINDLTGRRMELDGYCEVHKIAFEYNGEQHYLSDHPFNRSHQAFLDQVYRDNLKVELCDLHGVYLITIPYNTPFERLEDYIRYYLPEAVASRSEG